MDKTVAREVSPFYNVLFIGNRWGVGTHTFIIIFLLQMNCIISGFRLLLIIEVHAAFS